MREMTTSLRPQEPPASEIPDTDAAPPAIRACYDDIRATLRTGVVNLVFRRLAALGGDVLDVAWCRLRPAYADGRVERAAATLIGPTSTLQRSPEPDRVVKAGWSALPARDRRQVAALLRTYDLNNRRNLVAFVALLVDPMPGGAVAQLSPSKSIASPDDLAIPPLPRLAELAPTVQAAIGRLNAFGDDDPQGPTASLYVHLAYWPQILAATEEMLRPYELRGELRQGRMAVFDEATRLAAHFPDVTVGSALRDRLVPVIGPLITRTIPKMIPIGRLLLDVVSARLDAGPRDEERAQ